MVAKKQASGKIVVGEIVAMTSVETPEEKPKEQAVDVKGVKILFDERQIPQITFSGGNWNIRDILHIKRLLTREYKRYLRSLIRQDVKAKEEK